MDFNIEIRKKQLDNLDQVISLSHDRIASILKELEWSSEKVQEEDNLVNCPIDSNHRISPNCWQSHIEKCRLKHEGYDLKEPFLPDIPSDSSPHSIYLDHETKREIIRKEFQENPYIRTAWNGIDPDPRTSSRYISTFSVDERLALYNYTVEKTVGPETPPEFTTILPKKIAENENKTPTYQEILSQERDAKRRKIKYRQVHLNKKNHVEVIREVINNQMEEYKEYLYENFDEKRDIETVPETYIEYPSISDKEKEVIGDFERPHSSISRHSTHSGSSGRRYGDYKRKRSRDRSRDTSRSSREHSRNRNNGYDHKRRSPTRYYEDRKRRKSRSREPRELRESRRSRHYSDRRKH